MWDKSESPVHLDSLETGACLGTEEVPSDFTIFDEVDFRTYLLIAAFFE